MMANYAFDSHALHIAKHIMQLKKIAEIEGWPEGRLLAAIQVEIIAAMQWAAPERK
ncbi:hypothetical protein [Erwinia phyllosphaerae]|uniref:hypothetical protein n=1 Tax=Erwinia phyllosphaerae TaxID=2853256 RepID=UPI001FEFA11E|nr:hypothetical protein [Erwinia phyllosphaerae]MBV4365889.1 hypothetical protein [Erwinia phyllosphaerae]